MTSVEYDLDTSSGLMSKIQALIAPPENDDTSKSKKKEGLDLHPYYKRPGKGHNRDCCDACAEGGNLICCDKCPASFHLGCHDPPLEDEDIPLGQWLCHKCRTAIGLPPIKALRKEKSENGEKAEIASDNVSTASKEDTPTETSLKGRSRTSSTASVESVKSRRGRSAAVTPTVTSTPPSVSSTPMPNVSSNPVTTASVASGPDRETALDILISAASSMNPTQFELPRELVLPINFPGTDRAPLRGRKAAAAKRSRTHDLENGMVPLPAKFCYECRKTCRKAPLLACDYCPLLFHLDCLDPPLTSLPSGRWRCPNHVEQAIDERLLTSLSVTQRVALYDKYTGAIDQDAVKTEFLKKTRRKNPPFHFKVKLTQRNRAQVPNAVKELYKNRPVLIPTLNDVLRDNELASRLWSFPSGVEQESASNLIEAPTEKEQEEWLKGIVALQTSIACHLSSKKRKQSELADKDSVDFSEMEIKKGLILEDDATDSDINEDSTLVSCVPLSKAALANGLSDTPNFGNKDMTAHATSVQRDNPTLFSKSRKLYSVDVQNGEMEIDELKSSPSGSSPVNLDEKGTFRVAHLHNSGKSTQSNFSCDEILSKRLNEVLQDSVDCSVPDDVDLDHFDERLIRLLASQRLQQLIEGAKGDRPSPKPSEEVSEEAVMWPSIESGVRPRALLTPLNSSQPPMPIYYRVMDIGTGGDMDVCLSYYGHCNFVSAKHAVIICDEVNRHYELMNYSEHGTTVDNVLYSCDFSDKPPVKEREQPMTAQHHGRRSGGNTADASEAEVEVPPLIQKIRAIVDQRRGVTRKEESIPDMKTLPSNIGKVEVKCSCRSSSSSVIGGSGAGWEGTALLNHGSFIKFGCIQFAFSILNYPSNGQKPVSSESTESTESIGSETNLSLPHRILKRERDSTSSSTLTVSPSPPPDKVIAAVGHSHSTRFSKRNQKDQPSVEIIEEKVEKNLDESDEDETLENEKNTDENMEEFEDEEEEEEEEEEAIMEEVEIKNEVVTEEEAEDSLQNANYVQSTSGINSSDVASSPRDAV